MVKKTLLIATILSLNAIVFLVSACQENKKDITVKDIAVADTIYRENSQESEDIQLSFLGILLGDSLKNINTLKLHGCSIKDSIIQDEIYLKIVSFDASMVLDSLENIKLDCKLYVFNGIVFEIEYGSHTNSHSSSNYIQELLRKKYGGRWDFKSSAICFKNIYENVRVGEKCDDVHWNQIVGVYKSIYAGWQVRYYDKRIISSIDSLKNDAELRKLEAIAMERKQKEKKEEDEKRKKEIQRENSMRQNIKLI